MYTTITVQVIDQALQLTNIPKLASGGQNTILVDVEFDSSWTGYGKTAVFFRTSDESHIYNVLMTNDTCMIPLEVTANPGNISLSIRGVKENTTKVTEAVILNIVKGSIVEPNPFEPLPDVYKQVLSAYDKAARDLVVESARIDELSHLAEGSTTGDAELVDIRVDKTGNTYPNAGEAVRRNFKAQGDAIDSAMSTKYLTVNYTTLTDTGLVVNQSGQAKLAAAAGQTVRLGTIPKSGYYNLSRYTVLSLLPLNTNTYVTYMYYDAVNAGIDVYAEAGTNFCVYGGGNLVPSYRTSYVPEQIVVAVTPNEAELEIFTDDTAVARTEVPGILEGDLLKNAATRYTLYRFPVVRGQLYRLRSSNFSYPLSSYQLFGFTVGSIFQGSTYYIKGGLRTTKGEIDIVLRSPVDGYLYASNDINNPSNFTLNAVTSITRVSNIKRYALPYTKLLTIGDSLSGNTNLWQPKVIDLLDIQSYDVLGGAGLTVADQGPGVNTIYNRVMAMTADPAVDLITFWGGYNDFNSNITMSTLSAQLNLETRDATTFYGGLLSCVEKILTTYPQKTLVLIGTTPFNVNGDWTSKKNGQQLTIEDYVIAVKEVADHFSIPFLDLLHGSGFNNYNYATYYQDQNYWLHPNSTGNDLIGRKIVGFIKAMDGTYDKDGQAEIVVDGKMDIDNVVQTTGTGTDKVMSQNAVTTALNATTTAINGKLTKPANGTAGQVLVGDGTGNWGPGSIAQTGTTTVSVSGTTLVISQNVS